MKSVFSVDQIRRAENTLFEFQTDSDELMISAASAVADVALAMLAGPAPSPSSEESILLLVGPGGNGGDALYAGAFLAEEGHHVDALLLGNGKVHQSALSYFESLGGRVIADFPLHYMYRLVIDGLYGIGGRGGLSVELACLVESFSSSGIPILAIDVPSGVHADTGEIPPGVMITVDGFDQDAPMARQKVPAHINAEVTITFGGLRRAHAVSPACGEVLLADINIAGGGGKSLSAELLHIQNIDETPQIFASAAWPKEQSLFERAKFAETAPHIQKIGQHFMILNMEPSPDHDKYSGGIVGIVAGSDIYPGAAVLAVKAAVRATSSMVRYVGPAVNFVLHAQPEVVATQSLQDTGRVQAWVYGPGRGLAAEQQAELAELLNQPEPLLIDADGLSLLERSAELRQALKQRSARTVLTPHKGEFERVADSLRIEGVEIPEAHKDPIGAAQALSTELDCCVLLKGRFTVVAAHDFVHVINSGHSWLATPGSGDVLAGLIGAHLAQSYAELNRLPEFFPDLVLSDSAIYTQVAPAVTIHSVAAALAARTEFGAAPTSAGFIADAIPAATAKVDLKRIG
ncbi:bifunctional ADP-dependent NAD(P)H-hydrate dehydratase/NAD(P)H-hydrate epimerase [Corynebacterium crudilactis]|uniref:ADP-dependent (S)-NAD(P)H-hydrate dehydratase n=1 Tax=Corynebacterium crudilactis TaxID=1652495 RepID=A0A172QRI7_9CORY|nr:NAD(P)H-hydrate dehydratase [Corynebacterium crudilactis]ANE03288.1 NAD(P)H-hydrate epimerase [Corynebacterium crudilactis]